MSEKQSVEKFCTNCDTFVHVFPWEHHCPYCGEYLFDEIPEDAEDDLEDE